MYQPKVFSKSICKRNSLTKCHEWTVPIRVSLADFNQPSHPPVSASSGQSTVSRQLLSGFRIHLRVPAANCHKRDRGRGLPFWLQSVICWPNTGNIAPVTQRHTAQNRPMMVKISGIPSARLIKRCHRLKCAVTT